MKRLCLIRHAKSSWSVTGITDKLRPLDDRGRKEAPEMAERLKAFGLNNPRFYISAAERTYETGKIVTETLGVPNTAIHHLDSLYLATARILFHEVTTAEADNDLVIIGHNPGISDMASLVSGENIEMTTSCVVIIELHVEDWAAVSLGTGSIVYFDYPKKHRIP